MIAHDIDRRGLYDYHLFLLLAGVLLMPFLLDDRNVDKRSKII